MNKLTFLKILAVIIAIILCIIIFVKCTHEHNWSSPTCSQPSTCYECGKTRGTYLQHSWSLATCVSPKHCTLCGETIGSIGTHTWKEATCLSPKYCSSCGLSEGKASDHKYVGATCTTSSYCSFCNVVVGEPLGHSWVDATCKNPKMCSRCKISEGKKTNTHKWVEATCKLPKHCLVCSIQADSVLANHKWKEGNSATPTQCTVCGKMEPLALPQNGQVFIGANLSRYGELTIKSSTTKNCYIKLKDYSGNDVFSFFVRAGSTVTMDVPTGNYYVYFSYGTDWFGTQYVFGPNTTYSKDSSLLDFENYSWTYTLYTVVGGNFTETPIDADEFN